MREKRRDGVMQDGSEGVTEREERHLSSQLGCFENTLLKALS